MIKYLLVGFLLATVTVRAGPIVLESGPEQTSLLELYTSEGCSSCPPAEAWLSRLKENPGLWKKFVPVAFHVDYWNNLGWPDRFSSPEFTRRQHDYATGWLASTVYTPEFVLNGQEWRNHLDGVPATGEKPGVLRASVEQDIVTISYRPAAAGGSWQAHVAPLGGDIVTDVHAGENAGRQLPHEFVALQLLTAPLKPSASGACETRLTLPEKTVSPIRALAVWVSREGSITPVQAVGGKIR